MTGCETKVVNPRGGGGGGRATGFNVYSAVTSCKIEQLTVQHNHALPKKITAQL